MNTIILGAGFSGLSSGIVAPEAVVYEATDVPGGLGASYERSGYKFEQAGGHWLFGGDPSIIGFIRALTPCKRYERKASVFFPDSGEFYPYPLQSHEAFQETVELETGGEYGLPCRTMRDALRQQFGETLCQKFFFPFNNLYTAGLYDRIAPQDEYKNPKISTKGYNPTFLYPTEGLGMLARKMAARCNIRFGRRAQWIDVKEKMVHFADDTCQPYNSLISTLPLNRMMGMTSLHTQVSKADPHTSVLVLNIGAVRGPKCPDDHWVYVPHSKSGFHRVGFYSNVDELFLPEGAGNKVSIYVERSYLGGEKPTGIEATNYSGEVIAELREWGWIKELDVCDATGIDVAYTYKWPDSTWREDSLALLKKYDIHSIGRYGQWKFCGISDSIKDGFEAGVKWT